MHKYIYLYIHARTFSIRIKNNINFQNMYKSFLAMKLLQIILTKITNITQVVSNIFIIKTKYLIIIICFTALFQFYSYSNEPNIDLIVNLFLFLRII